MEISEILEMLSAVPIWLWIIGAVILVFAVFGESTLWDYEVKFPFEEGIGRGKVELECGNKKGPRIECLFEMSPSYQNISLDIFLGEEKIYTVPAEKNNSNRLYLREHISLDKPREGDLVVVKANQEAIFSGPLVLD